MLHRAAVLSLLVLASPSAIAGPLPKERVPVPLKPWTDWVLRGQESALCPSFLGSDDTTRCLWPGRLALALGEHGGTFTQEWSVEAAGFVPLPGDDRRWPLDVTLDGKPAVAVTSKENENLPGLWVPPGRHRAAGTFRWDALPEGIPVSKDVGLVALTVRGAAVPFPERDDEGQVLLQRAPAAAAEEESLDLVVQRRVTDEVPLLLTTRLDLAVAGKAREVLLGRALPAGFIPMALDAPLPARLEPNGRLRVQVRPGRWTLVLTARHEGPVAALTLPAADGPWAAEEVWVFDARPALRLADVEGVPAVDPQQTQLPDDWKSLPAYRMRPGDTLRLAERRRGDADPAPDQLALHRVLWLDFDGGGYTWQDQLSGTLTRSWRLEMATPTALERVVVGGRDQVITRRTKPGERTPLAGIEVRQGRVLLAAEGRLAGRFAVPAVGWDHDFQQVSGVLNLPPGWKLLAATGVDQVPGTWLSRWTLLDLFLVLIIALIVRHLWGTRWGLLALAAMVLAWQEPAAPRWIWLAVLATAAVLRFLPPTGRFRTFVRLLWAASLLGLVLITVAFLAQHLRQAIYPALEYPYAAVGPAPEAVDRTAQASLASAAESAEAQARDRINVGGNLEEPKPAAPVPANAPEAEEGALRVGAGAPTAAPPPPPPPPPPAPARSGFVTPSFKKRAVIQEIDPHAVVTTGPGLPAWHWNQVALRWSGPVTKSQNVRFFLVSPAANLGLAFLRAALLVLLLLRAAGITSIPPSWRRPPAPSATTAAALLGLLLAACLLLPLPARAETPPQEILDKLREALTEKPDCHPRCAASPRLFVEVTPSVLRLRQEVGAAAAVAVPIAGGAQQWVPADVQLDGAPAAVVRSDDGQLWVRVGPGRHEILASGPLPPRDVVQVPLPLKPHRAEATAAGWTIDGIHENGEADDNLQLSRIRGTASPAAASGLQPGELPPFLEVARTLHLGLTWQVETRISRRSPSGVPVVASVPLLAGESVTTAGTRVQKGAVAVSLAPQDAEMSWSSTLEPRPELVLTAPRTLAWTEVWMLDASPIWHFEAQGIPPVHGSEDAATRIPEWRPWPGETVRLAVSRPEGIAGQTLTIDRVLLTVTPGLRTTDVRLELSVRSSRGGRHTIVLPPHAELTGVTVDGQAQPLRQEGRNAALPIHPGAQTFLLQWREDRGASLLFRTSEVDLSLTSVNAQVTVANPASRWILLLGGPRLGPAVLFWSLLLVLVLVAIGLSRLPWTPLGLRDWTLLGVGLSQLPLLAGALVAGWLLALGARRQKGAAIRDNQLFDLAQVLLAVWTLMALGLLFWAIQRGLLGTPEMQILGNGSTAAELRWYADRSGHLLPTAAILSVPLLVYRLAMLAWALWLALALLRWLRWGWESFTAGGGWRRFWRPRVPKAGPDVAAAQVAPLPPPVQPEDGEPGA